MSKNLLDKFIKTVLNVVLFSFPKEVCDGVVSALYLNYQLTFNTSSTRAILCFVTWQNPFQLSYTTYTYKNIAMFSVGNLSNFIFDMTCSASLCTEQPCHHSSFIYVFHNTLSITVLLSNHYNFTPAYSLVQSNPGHALPQRVPSSDVYHPSTA